MGLSNAAAPTTKKNGPPDVHPGAHA